MSELLERIGLAFKCFFLVLFAGRLPDVIPARFLAGVASAPVKEPAAESERQKAEPPRPVADRAVQLLTLLQRDGRLVDFLCEDISAYPDDQVGAAAREVHASCREVLLKYVGLEPVMPGEEGTAAVVEPGFDPAEVKLVGAVVGKPPFRGVLRHRGWRASRVDLPPVTDPAGITVIAPAEVELG
jgi:hypothetical protein